MRTLLLCLLCSCGPAPRLLAQAPVSPDDFLPHRLGETFTPHHLLVDYFGRVAEQSDRVRLEGYGTTNEGRPLLLAYVSSPENLARLDDIRQNNLRRAGLLPGNATDEDVAIVWLSYSVHGNEAAGSEASMSVLHALADPTDRRHTAWLRNTVVIIDPSLNPDGYNRYTNWHRQWATTRPAPEPAVREHREPWPGGRVNHYLFDLNRDWAWQTQVESRQRMVKYREWMPHIHADVHEQEYTSPYYFAPAAAPFHEYITDWQAEFQTEIGRNHATYFDRAGWLYFTRERFDLLYPSYGDTWPTFNGAIGMTYEQAGHGRAGRAIELPNGDTLTLADRILHHRTTSLSTVEIASREAGRLVDNFARYFRDARENPRGRYASYLVSGRNPAGKLRRLRQLLDRNGIRYQRVRNAQSLNGYAYRGGQRGDFTAAAGDLLIPAHQPRSVLTQALFDPAATLEDSVTYDITAWSVPLAYGLEAYATTGRLRAGDLEDFPPAGAPALGALAGEDLSEVYSFVIPWADNAAAACLAGLLDAGVRVRRAAAGFTFGQRTFAPGALVVNRGDNRRTRDFVATVRRLTEQHGVDVTPLRTGFSSSVGGDLGGGNFDLVAPVRVATLAGEQVGPNEFGQLWYHFEQELNYPLHIFRDGDLDEVLAGDYDVLVLAEGRYRLDEAARESLLGWVRDGGKLIAIGAANAALAGQEGFGLAKKEAADPELSPEEERERRLLPYGGRERRFIGGFVPGAIVATELDATHPLAFGLGDTYYSLKTDDAAYDYLAGGYTVGRVRTGAAVTGFVGHRAYADLQESLSFGVEPLGGGQVIYLVDNPLFRAFWEEGKLLFANALFQVQ